MVTALAIDGQQVVAVGDEALDWSTSWDDVVDLAGRCVVPGFRDGHAHPLHGGTELSSLRLDTATTVADAVARVARWAHDHPADEWIVGSGHTTAMLPNSAGRAEWLDAVVPDRPVALYSSDHHTMWVNSAALHAAGITRDTVDPSGGVIVRRADGEPLGALFEFGALALVEAVMPKRSADDLRTGLRTCLDELARHGIVWAQDALVDEDLAETYIGAATTSPLSCRFNLAFGASPERWQGQRRRFVELRQTIAADANVARSLSARTIKFFADGVIEAGTGFLTEPYEDAPHTCGLPNWSPGGLAEAVSAFSADGFQIHIHAIGDGGVRMALDAIEHAQRQHGAADRRPVIAHTQLVHADDLERFAALGVIANFEPLWCQLDPVMVENTMPRLGPRRSGLQFQIRTIAESGARVSFGSDWPVSSVNPVAGMSIAVSRTTDDGQPVGGWTPDEKIPMLQALHAYTAGTAYQAFDDNRGALRPGAVADLAVLAADITAMDGDEARHIEVDQTVLDGTTVFRRG